MATKLAVLLKSIFGWGLTAAIHNDSAPVIPVYIVPWSLFSSQVEISKSYGRNEWREDLKRILRRAGGEARPCVFLFSDTQV
jgi:dynein heavy chain